MVISLFDVYLPHASLCFYKHRDKYQQLLVQERYHLYTENPNNPVTE